MCEKEPKFKVGQKVRCEWLGFEGEVKTIVPVRGGIFYGVTGNPRLPEHHRTVLEESRLKAVDEKPSLVEADFSELEQRIAAYLARPIFFSRPFHSGGFADALRAQANRDAELAHAAISQVIDGFNKLRADIEDDSEEDNMVEPAVEAMSLLDALRSSLNSIRAKSLNAPGLGVKASADEAIETLGDLADAVDELIEQRDTARAEGPEYEFTEEGRTIAPLFVPPGSIATWLFGAGALETQTGYVEGQKVFEFGLATEPAVPGDKIVGERSREPHIRMMFIDDDAIQRLIDGLTRLKESPAVHNVG